MAGGDFGQLIYLVLLGVVLIGWYLARHRGNLNRTLQQALLWALLFAGVVVLYGFRDELRQQVMPQTSVMVEGNKVMLTRAGDGHFYARLKIDGKDIVFVVDTGASDLVLSRRDAIRLGINPDDLVYVGTASTANGLVRTARVKLASVELGGFVDRNVTAWVNDGEMQGSLLGMAYLNRFRHLEISGDTLTLTR